MRSSGLDWSVPDALSEEADRESCLSEGSHPFAGSSLDLHSDTAGRLDGCTATDLVRLQRLDMRCGATDT